jgi:glycosyl-4,4'-diaponeurosporenoate acyltransferase
MIGIGKWKELLPEAGALFRGGFRKRRMRSLDSGYLEGFRRETNRAEFSHWITLISGMSFFVWNPWQIGCAMVAYAVLTNLPFIAIQRYNRPRLDKLAGQVRSREHPGPESP